MEIILFGLLSLPLVALSWRSLFSPKNHGFYRWVVWECVLWLAIQNHRHLIVERLDLQQLISSALMTASPVFVFAALWMMRKMGNVNRQRRDPTLFGFEKTTNLVESGIFRHVRHPMCSSLMFLAWGICLRRVEVGLLAVTVVATGACVLAAWVEEKENTAYFGEEYRHYMLRTKRFIPYVV
jgi:protein-S-isoprenylcysteine O-methyltransferase Ste14